ncbi:hypothetical protein JCM10207_002150 [Rhodosporidiobolus poonsookiae]
MRSRLFASLLTLAFCAPLARAQVPAFDLSEIRTIFSFGDSWTTTGYTPSEGVEDIEQFQTSSAGPSWIQYLAWNHTAAGSAYYDLASLGGTVSTQVVWANGATDFAGQTGEFIAYFNETTSSVQWDSESSLFTVFFGNDDVYNCFVNGYNFLELQPRMLTAFDQNIAKLYEAGARNFLLLSLPSLDLSPLARSLAGADIPIRAALEYWNARLEVYAMFLSAKYAGTQVKWFDARNWTRGVIDEPAEYGLEDATTYCEAYSTLGYAPNANDSTCTYSLASYFWKDVWHPTWRVHELMASAIASLLSSETPSLTLPSSTASAIFSPSSASNFSSFAAALSSVAATATNASTSSSAASTAMGPANFPSLVSGLSSLVSSAAAASASASESVTAAPASVTVTTTTIATHTSTSTVEPVPSNRPWWLVYGTTTSGGASSRAAPGVTLFGAAVAAGVVLSGGGWSAG